MNQTDITKVNDKFFINVIFIMKQHYINLIGFTICMALIEMIAQYNMKEFNLKGTYSNYIIGVFFHIISITLFSFALSYEKIGIVNHLWNVFSSLFAFLMAKIYFFETITHFELIGFMFSMIGIIFMGIN